MLDSFCFGVTKSMLSIVNNFNFWQEIVIDPIL